MASRTHNVRSENINDDSFQQPLHKRHKQWSDSALTQEEYSILNESPPLGLNLKKSKSFVEILQAVPLFERSINRKDDTLNSRSEKESRAHAVKPPATNFRAMYLKIGSWEYKSKQAEDLVAKCYYARKKLIWEVLDVDGDRKRKIEIKWADITALKANCPEDGHSSLTLVVARQPLFFMEADLLPGGKPAQWVSTADFTGGQASTHRMHFLQCEQGLLTKHYEKLIQCSSHLNRLSKKPDIKLDSPYFVTLAASEKPDNLEDCDLHQVNGKGSAMTRFQNTSSPHSSLSPSFTIEHDYLSPISVPCEAPSSSSEGIYCSEADLRGPSNLDQIEQPGLPHSNSLSYLDFDLIEEMDFEIILDNVTHDLPSDNVEVTIASDDSSLISKVNSFDNVLDLDRAEVPNPPDIGHEENIELGDDLESNEGNEIEMDIEVAAEEDPMVAIRHQA